MQILLVDDDLELCQLLKEWLIQDNFNVDCVHNCADALAQVSKYHYAVLILDVMLPDGSGLDLLKNIRKLQPQLPILMLSARGEPLDKTLGLELGADDYLAKPCDARELSARLRAIVRRNTQIPSPKIECDDLIFDVARGEVTFVNSDVVANLTVSEGQILSELLQNPGDIIDKQKLSSLALGRKLTAFDRSLDMHVSNLRKKLGNNQNDEPRILSSRGRGYYYNI